MNKKLKIYSTLFVVAIIILAVTSTFHYNSVSWSSDPEETMELVESAPEFMSCDTLANGSVVTTQHPYIGYEVSVKPKNKPNQKMLLSKSYGQTYRVNMKKVDLEVPASDVHSALPMILIISSAVVAVVVAIWIVFLVFKLIRNIRKGEIFVTKVSRYLETAGILLSVLYLYTLVVSYATTQYFIHNLHIADYYIVFNNECNGMYILTGLALMIISQIILMGKDLKEEQELTI
jgi:hypothetical protein